MSVVTKSGRRQDASHNSALLSLFLSFKRSLCLSLSNESLLSLSAVVNQLRTIGIAQCAKWIRSCRFEGSGIVVLLLLLPVLTPEHRRLDGNVRVRTRPAAAPRPRPARIMGDRQQPLASCKLPYSWSQAV